VVIETGTKVGCDAAIELHIVLKDSLCGEGVRVLIQSQ